LVPGDRIVHVGCASSHRAAALEACAFLIDRLKTDAPLWKQEVRSDGSATWVEAKTGDDERAERWRV
jgi:molybdopterin synthase catalytic subunit